MCSTVARRGNCPLTPLHASPAWGCRGPGKGGETWANPSLLLRQGAALRLWLCVGKGQRACPSPGPG